MRQKNDRTLPPYVLPPYVQSGGSDDPEWGGVDLSHDRELKLLRNPPHQRAPVLCHRHGLGWLEAERYDAPGDERATRAGASLPSAPSQRCRLRPDEPRLKLRKGCDRLRCNDDFQGGRG